MSQSLPQATKDKIQKVLTILTENYLEDFSNSQREEKYSHCQRLAFEKLETHFFKIENDYELLSEVYDQNGHVQNLEKFKKLSCEYAESLI